MSPFRVALDWTPNINHAGFFVAQARGYYEEVGLEVKFISPHVDDYKVTPAQKVSAGDAEVAICPSETVVSYACQAQGEESGKGRLKAVAAILTKDTSAIVTLKESGLDRPASLEGKRYASYGARYEGRIVQKMIQNDGGSGEYIEDADMSMLGIWNTLLAGKADATWVFLGWEGVIANLKGVELNTFSLEDYKIPYGYSPVLVSGECEGECEALKKFMAASGRGWDALWSAPSDAAAEATACIAQLFPSLPEAIDGDVMAAAAEYIAPFIKGDFSPWGTMEGSRWEGFLDWLSEAGMLTNKMQSRQPDGTATVSLDDLRSGNAGEAIPREAITANDLFTNDFISM